MMWPQSGNSQYPTAAGIARALERPGRLRERAVSAREVQ